MNLHDFGLKDDGTVTLALSTLGTVICLVLGIALVIFIGRVKKRRL